MKKLGATIAATVVAVSFLGASSVEPAAAMSQAFDGVWSVSIATVNGTCPTGLRYPAVITNGRIVQASGENGYQISGEVNNAGAIVVTVSDGGKSATGRGRISRTNGGGTWMTSDRQCSGTWAAERRNY